MPVFGIMHTIKLKANNTMGVQLENNRTKKDCERTFAGSQIEWDRTDENVHWVHSGNWDKSAYELCQKYDVQKVKKDSVIALQTVYTASREWFTMDENGGLVFDEKAEQFFRDCMKFHVDNYCGGREDLLINAVVHLDEIHADGTGSIHFHCTSVPIVENERGEFVLSAKRVLGGRKEMTQSQTKFYDDVCKSRGMTRGMSSNETKRKHLDNLSYKAEQEQKKLQATLEAQERAEKQTKTQEHDLEIAKAKTESEAHKTVTALEHRMDKVAEKTFFGKKKEKEYPGGTYYEVSKGDYERLERHVNELRSKFDEILKTDFAGQEAVKKLQDMLRNEEQYILTVAAAMANERFQQVIEREKESEKREQQTKQLEQQAQEELAQAVETKNNMGAIAQQIAFEAVNSIPQELQDEHNFVMEHLAQTNPWAYNNVQQALEQRNQRIAQEVEKQVEKHHHRHR